MSIGHNIASALTVAGSDSGGGAGVQADLRTFFALGVFGCSAVTALTAQNPLEVRRVDAVPSKGVSVQIEAVLDAIDIAAVKTGMLFSASTVRTVAAALAKLKAPIVVDPVAVSTSGSPLLKPDAVGAMKTDLLPLAAWLTPNLPEASLLLGKEISSERSMLEAAAECERRWGCATIIKGGHFKGSSKLAVDIVCRKGLLYKLSSPKASVRMHSDHGTGCTFSAALAALLAKGSSWEDALLGAKSFVLSSLAEPVRLSSKACAMFPPSGLPGFAKGVSLEKVK